MASMGEDFETLPLLGLVDGIEKKMMRHLILTIVASFTAGGVV